MIPKYPAPNSPDAQVRVFLVKAISLALSTSFLLGCSSNQNQESALFQKKVECEKYAEKTRQEYRETGPLMPGGAAERHYYVERIFYSPKRDSCLCVLGNNIKKASGEDVSEILVIDALTKKLLWAREFKSSEMTGDG